MKINLILFLIFISLVQSTKAATYTSHPQKGLLNSCKIALAKAKNPVPFDFLKFIKNYGPPSLFINLSTDVGYFRKGTKKNNRHKGDKISLISDSKSIMLTLIGERDISLTFYYYAKAIQHFSVEYAYRNTNMTQVAAEHFFDTLQNIALFKTPNHYYSAIGKYIEADFSFQTKGKIDSEVQKALNSYNDPKTGNYDGAVIGGKMQALASSFDSKRAIDSLYRLMVESEGYSMLEIEYHAMSIQINSGNKEYLNFMEQNLVRHFQLIKQ